METRVSIDSQDIHRYPDTEALAFVDEILGAPEAWSPSLIAYRLSSDFQANWKIEVGHWLLFARDAGFLERLRKRIIDRALGEAASPSVTGANDSAHRTLLSELASVMVAHYFTRLGWRFQSWEPPRPIPKGDIDLRLESPSGLVVDVQVKAPDQPGEFSNGRIVNGEIDERVLKAMNKAVGQLKFASGPGRMVVVCPQRTWPIEADVLACYLLGKPTTRSEEVWGICREGGGVFSKPPGSEIAAVVALSYDCGLDKSLSPKALYRCIAIRNPWAPAAAAIPAACFPHARVLSLIGDRFVWEPEEPGKCFRFRTGTPLLQEGTG
jgi:hypothetical protein